MLRLTHAQQNLLLLNFLYTVYNIIQAKEYRPSFCTRECQFTIWKNRVTLTWTQPSIRHVTLTHNFDTWANHSALKINNIDTSLQQNNQKYQMIDELTAVEVTDLCWSDGLRGSKRLTFVSKWGVPNFENISLTRCFRQTSMSCYLRRNRRQNFETWYFQISH